MNKTNTKNTFSNHVLELRKRLIISVITILISGIITFIFHKDILEFLLKDCVVKLHLNGCYPSKLGSPKLAI